MSQPSAKTAGHTPSGIAGQKIRVLEGTILGFASPLGSRRYISPGNALLFLMDHALQTRLKIWANAEVSEDPAIIEKLAKTRGHSPATHLGFLFHVRAFGWNYEKDAVQCSIREVHSTKPLRPGKSDPLSTKMMDTKRCLTLAASNGVWTLNSHCVGIQV